MSYVTAKRGNETRQFSASTWETMPLTKYGWRLCAEEPEVVRGLKLAKETTPQEYAELIAKARAAGDQEKLNLLHNATIDK